MRGRRGAVGVKQEGLGEITAREEGEAWEIESRDPELGTFAKP